ncbi:hypothetical protein JIN84_10795 [Luteolibacter yonseiensis]|uniref:Transmembrane protein n=1 Tax=Luteolibacter yonseiensis TaxID=1144680 RepID=A0A934R6F1_9BACT|nr:hypothetical protein [Luteolibacter yonseiensis]MBK1816100.1 hypothetical protein [Luteolibacter yonseiensis]
MKNPQSPPVGHVLVPACAIGSLSILLVVGLGLLGILGRLDSIISRIVVQDRFPSFPKSLPEWWVWLVTVLLAFAISFSILSVPATWRRLVIWITALVLIAGWAPALVLAAHAPAVAAPFIAVIWSGVCAVVYAGRHRMPVDGILP